MAMPEKSLETPLGWLRLTERDGAIIASSWGRGGDDDTPLLAEAAHQVAAYFNHELEAFDLPLEPEGDGFQQAVAEAMRAIPYGATREYGEIAKDLDAMPQAVGSACGNNSIGVIIPCHRVVAADGLGGFSAPGGVETKVALLRHEGAYALLI